LPYRSINRIELSHFQLSINVGPWFLLSFCFDFVCFVVRPVFFFFCSVPIPSGSTSLGLIHFIWHLSSVFSIYFYYSLLSSSITSAYRSLVRFWFRFFVWFFLCLQIFMSIHSVVGILSSVLILHRFNLLSIRSLVSVPRSSVPFLVVLGGYAMHPSFRSSIHLLVQYLIMIIIISIIWLFFLFLLPLSFLSFPCIVVVRPWFRFGFGLSSIYWHSVEPNRFTLLQVQ
jgi:hypothetical protein